MDEMDGVDEGRWTATGQETGLERDGRTRTGTDGGLDERIRARIAAVEAERDQFALMAPMRADERMLALRAQLQLEMDLRMQSFEQQIANLQALLSTPEGVSQEEA